MVYDLGTLFYSCSSCFSKIQNSKSTKLCAGSLDGAPIHRHFTKSKTKTLSKDRSIIQHFIHATGIRCFLCILRLQCDCDCDWRDSLRCCCSNTTPPLETSKRSHSSERASHGRTRRAGTEKKKFLVLDMCWLLKHNSGRNPHTEVQYMVYLSAAPNCTPFSTLPRLCLGGSCRRQLRQAHCTGATHSKAVGPSKYHNIGHSYRS